MLSPPRFFVRDGRKAARAEQIAKKQEKGRRKSRETRFMKNSRIFAAIYLKIFRKNVILYDE